jgi:hypothetical protein
MPEVHILPEDYVGPVVILFDQPLGEEIQRNNDGALVYRIPAGGVLCAKNAAPRAGLYSKRFYNEGPTGARQELPHRVSDGVTQVFADGYGVTEVLDGQPTGGVRWLAYVVGVPSTRADWVQLRDAAVERAVRGTKQNCSAAQE